MASRTRRDSGGLVFFELGDGSTVRGLQVVVEKGADCFAVASTLPTGAAVRVAGVLERSPAKGQDVELRGRAIEVLGWADPAEYPLQKKRHSFEFLRSIAHLRPRTNALGAVARVRHRLAKAIHDRLDELGFAYVHTPVVTTLDCEGAGEMFTVTTTPPGRVLGEDGFAGDFFSRWAGLTVSGQLQAEVYALALGRVYTFGPTFRAEHSNTSRHLAEFWMVEPEMAFADLADDVALAEDLVRFCLQRVLDGCAEEIDLFDRFVHKGLRRRLERAAGEAWVSMSYREAVAELERCGRAFEYPVAYGMDLQAEHERYLCEEVARGPLVVTDYPAALKPFYMRLNDDGETVAAMDLLVPGVGELVGGSQREERYEVLADRMREAGLDLDAYRWYLDLRRFGSAPHAGFGLGFERLVQFVTGMANIREVIPFPRTVGHAPC